MWRLVMVIAWVLGLGCAATPAKVTPTSDPKTWENPDAEIYADIEAIIEAPDRDPEDLEADERRRPGELLAFLHLEQGMQVADIGAGFGYTTELLARAVGPTGKVWGQNPKFVLERFAEEGWTKRLAKPVNANVIRVDREFVDPLPPEAKDLDAVVNVLFYHDFEWMKVDRAAHNRAIFAALKPGGRYVVVDAHAKAGAGASESQTLHRIEELLVLEELQAAGFQIRRRGDFLRNPNDARDWNALPWQNEEGPHKGELSDKFVIEARKPPL